ncbi:hypothetical protein [Pseudonocardia spinosispora]|uniref:hypothetical protein n=1 Tax=Pseudonocardia spinosispora TaxID=103441 RepID=UPI000406B410|nr:hypothetical protein [Pseudonocardia spinosispora]
MSDSTRGRNRFVLTAGTGLIIGVVASIVTGMWWLVAVGLALGAGASGLRR